MISLALGLAPGGFEILAQFTILDVLHRDKDKVPILVPAEEGHK